MYSLGLLMAPNRKSHVFWHSMTFFVSYYSEESTTPDQGETSTLLTMNMRQKLLVVTVGIVFEFITKFYLQDNLCLDCLR